MDGLNIDPQILANTQANIIAQNAIRMVQLEAAIQQLGAEITELRSTWTPPQDSEVEEDASAN